jgi:DNA-binding PadR family transcriptional regulator
MEPEFGHIPCADIRLRKKLKWKTETVSHDEIEATLNRLEASGYVVRKFVESRVVDRVTIIAKSRSLES